MTNKYLSVKSPEIWRQLLADPQKHWKPGYSAWEAAHTWLAVNGFPPEVKTLFSTSTFPALQKAEMLLGIPEFKVLLPPRRRHPSQNDLFILARDANDNLISITIEAKVSESFGKTIAKWRVPPSNGKSIRYKFLVEKLGLSGKDLKSIRYQFLHRLASAFIEAERFCAKHAIVIIHSFSSEDIGLDDYKTFLDLFGVKGDVGQLTYLTTHTDIAYYFGWAKGSLNKSL